VRVREFLQEIIAIAGQGELYELCW